MTAHNGHAAISSEFRFTSSDGMPIACVRWSNRGPLRGVVQIAHGMAEHIGRYGETVDAHWLSRDDAVVDAFLDDPLCFAELKPAALASFLAAAPRLADPVNLQRIRDDLPIYVFSGSDDPVGQELLGVQALIERFREAGIHDIAHDFYSGGRHEMLNEINRAEVRARPLGWISAELDRQEGRFEPGFGHIDSLVN